MSTDDPRIVDLDSLLDNVNDEATFVAFVGALADDFALEIELEDGNPASYSRGLLGWENGTVDNVLGAAAAWGHDTLITGASPEGVNPWQRCAHILYAGKWYE